MKIVTVVPLKKGLWKEDLTYFSAQDIPNGSIVTVPLRNKKVLGLVIDSEDVGQAKSNIKGMSFNLKKVSEVKEYSIFRKEYIETGLEIAKYFVASKNSTIVSLIPSAFREHYDMTAKINSEKYSTKKITSNSSQNLKSEKMLLQMSLEDRISTYKTLIRGSFAQKKSVFIVLPTEYDLKIFEEYLAKGIEQFTFALHGSIAAKKIIKKFEAIVTLEHPILILGTAPFLSIPRGDIETIIMERESSNAYKMLARPHLDLRLFAELFAAKIGARFILSDTLLSFSGIARAEINAFSPVHPLSYRINFPGEIVVLGKGEKFKILEEKSIQEIRETIGKKKNVFIFALRKGLATMTVCQNCGEMVACEKCGAPLVLYVSEKNKNRMFACNKCEREAESDTSCKYCSSWNLIPLGIGTDTVYEQLKKIFPAKEKIKIFKLDKESVKSAKEADKITKEFEENPGSILVGTEMAFFYLRNKVTLSIVASFDSLWSIPNFKMSERIIQIMLSIINRTEKKFIIQTKNENDKAVLAIKNENLLPFVREELVDRKELGYAPYKRFIKITHLGDKEQTARARKMLEENFKEYNPEIFSGFVARLKGKYTTNALIKLNPDDWSLPEISHGGTIDENLLQKLMSLQPNFEVFVDPEDLL